MSSENSITELLEKLSEWSEEDVKSNIENVLPILLSSLSSDDESQRFQAVLALLTTCLPCLPLSEVQQRILQQAVPAVRQLFTDALEGIQSTLDEGFCSQSDDIGSKLISFLQVCFELLRCAHTVLEFVASQGRVEVAKICSVPGNVARLLLDAFQHCKESESVYGDLFSVVSDTLSLVFRESHQIQVHFFTVVTENVQFNCNVQNDLLLLIEVLETVSIAGETLLSMDVKVMAEQWKGYTRLTQMYIDHLQQRLDVTKPLTGLVLEVEKQLQEIVKLRPPESKSAGKLLKIGSFLLKIIIKICEQFGGGYLGKSGWTLFHLLLTLYRHSPVFHGFSGVADTLTGEIERYILVAADPLLGLLLSDFSFQNNFYNWCTQVSDSHYEMNAEENATAILLIISIMKQLLHCDTDVRVAWTSKDSPSNIFSGLFSIVKSECEHFTKDVNFEVATLNDSPPREMDLYGAAVAHAGALIVSARSCEFASLERVLLINILQPHPWTALLAADLWCILARTSSSEMCLDQIFFLVDVYDCMLEGNLQNQPEKVYLFVLIRRLTLLLNTQGRILLAEKLCSKTRPLMWQTISPGSLPEPNKSSLTQQLVSRVRDSITHYLNDGLCADKFVRMMDSMCGLSAVFQSGHNISSSNYCSQLDTVTLMWMRIPQDELILKRWLTTAEIQDSICFWLEYFVVALCRLTEYLVQSMNNQQILQVLKSVHAVTAQCSSSVKLHTLKVLKGLAKKCLDNGPDQNKVCNKIATLFADLLQDSSPLVCFSTLEVFAYFAHITKHENIFVNTVEENRILKSMVTKHLQKSHLTPSDKQLEVMSTQDYFKMQSKQKFVHKCVVKALPDDFCELLNRPAKKLKLDEDLNLDVDDLMCAYREEEFLEAVKRLKEDTALIVLYSAVNPISESSLKDLKCILSDLKKIAN